MTEFKPGDVVQLKTGGPSMGVAFVTTDGGAPAVIAIWQNTDGIVHRSTLPFVLLRLVPDRDSVEARAEHGLASVRDVCREALHGQRRSTDAVALGQVVIAIAEKYL
jgi:uncharacterized protein YodC (DUF2158 family)